MKISKRFRKLVAVVMAALIINIAIITPVLDVKASDIPAEASAVAIPSLQDLYEILGITFGMGTTFEGMAGVDDAMVQDIIDQVNAGESLQIGDTTIPDITTYEGAMAYLDMVYNEYYGHVEGTDVNPYLEAMDAKSYAATGSLYSKTMRDALELAAQKLSQEVIDRGFQVLQGGAGSSSGSPDDDDPFDFGATTMLLNMLIAGQAVYGGTIDDDWLAPVSSSEWNSSSLFTVNYDYNGVNVPVMKTSSYSFTWHSSNIENKLVFNKPVFVVCAGTQTRSPYIHIAYDEEFTYTLYSKSNGEWVAGATSNVNSLTDGLYYKSYGFSNYVSSDSEFVTVVDNNAFAADFRQTVAQELYGFNYTDNAGSIDSSVTDAFSGYGRKRITQTDVVNLANDLSGLSSTLNGTVAGISAIADAIENSTSSLPESDVDAGDGLYSGILGSIYDLLKNLASLIWNFFATPLSNILNAIKNIPNALAEVFAGILTIPQILLDDIASPLYEIKLKLDSISDGMNGGGDPTEPNNGHSDDYPIIFSALLILIVIIIKLLMIFFHCMQFIIAIFAIQPSTAFLPEEMVMGLDYIKQLNIPGIGMSVYGFMMGLIYIIILFYAIRTLRLNINHLRMPGGK